GKTTLGWEHRIVEQQTEPREPPPPASAGELPHPPAPRRELLEQEGHERVVEWPRGRGRPLGRRGEGAARAGAPRGALAPDGGGRGGPQGSGPRDPLPRP